MSDSDSPEMPATAAGAKFWTAVKLVAALAWLVVMTYFPKHDPFAALPIPAWVGVGMIGLAFVTLSIMEIKTRIAYATHARTVLRSDNPAWYWTNTAIHMSLGLSALGAATGAAAGLWTLR